MTNNALDIDEIIKDLEEKLKKIETKLDEIEKEYKIKDEKLTEDQKQVYQEIDELKELINNEKNKEE